MPCRGIYDKDIALKLMVALSSCGEDNNPIIPIKGKELLRLLKYPIEGNPEFTLGELIRLRYLGTVNTPDLARPRSCKINAVTKKGMEFVEASMPDKCLAKYKKMSPLEVMLFFAKAIASGLEIAQYFLRY